MTRTWAGTSKQVHKIERPSQRLDSLEANPKTRALLDRLERERAADRARLAQMPTPEEIKERRIRGPQEGQVQ